MSALKRMFKVVRALAIVLLVLALAVLMLPPWWGKSAYLIHIYTSIPYHFGWPPQSFSGVWRIYGDGKSYDEMSYLNGHRHGPQRYFDKSGRLVRTWEFRDGKPWSGLCDFWDGKPWLAEYRDGKLWNGAMQEYDDKSPTGYSMRYYYEGKLYIESDYRHRMGYGTNGSLIGIHCVGSHAR